MEPSFLRRSHPELAWRNFYVKYVNVLSIDIGKGFSMDKKHMARVIAAEFGGDIEKQTEELLMTQARGGEPRELFLAEATGIASLLISAVGLALQLYDRRMKREKLIGLLDEQAPEPPVVPEETRRKILERVADKVSIRLDHRTDAQVLSMSAG